MRGNVTKAIYAETIDCNGADQKEITEIFKECLALNSSERVPIAHGTWFIDETSTGVRHTSRNRLATNNKYPKIEDLERQCDRVAILKSRLVRFLTGPIPTKAT